ncbi:MAG: AAA family ATPase [Candidatus Diapherotrites archaeon]
MALQRVAGKTQKGAKTKKITLRVLVTGTPGAGKSSVSRALARLLKIKRVINEKEFALSKGLGKWDKSRDELVVPLGKLAAVLNTELKKPAVKIGGAIIEGHMLCETKLGVDAVVLLRTHPELLQAGLERRGYGAEKVQDNVFCEGIDYCRKHVLRRYPKKRVVELYVKRTAAETAAALVELLG